MARTASSGGIISPSGRWAAWVWLMPNILPILKGISDASEPRQVGIGDGHDFGFGIAACTRPSRSPSDHLAVENQRAGRPCDQRGAGGRGVKSRGQNAEIDDDHRTIRTTPEASDDPFALGSRRLGRYHA